MNTNYPYIKDRIVDFIRTRNIEAGTKGAIIGLSGGIDSALTAYLAAGALGAGNVLGLLLPEKGITGEKDIDDAMEIVRILGIDQKVIDISGILDSFSSAIPGFDRKDLAANGNLKARTRMCILYYHANLMHRMVIGTGNRTELLLGYFTKYGDGGVDMEPIGGLYKTQVRGLARYIGLPVQIIEKIPTAGLWPGQTDEGELGVSYETADRILSMLVDEKRDISAVKKIFLPGHVERVTALLNANVHKRMPPLSCEIG